MLVPIPTFGCDVPEAQLEETHPSTMALLSDTSELAPIAVAFVRLPEFTFAPSPRAELKLPVVFEKSAALPLAVLKLPVVFESSAEAPLAVFSPPVVLKKSASTALAVLLSPVVLWESAQSRWPC